MCARHERFQLTTLTQLVSMFGSVTLRTLIEQRELVLFERMLKQYITASSSFLLFLCCCAIITVYTRLSIILDKVGLRSLGQGKPRLSCKMLKGQNKAIIQVNYIVYYEK